jgi:hypothetical protein
MNDAFHATNVARDRLTVSWLDKASVDISDLVDSSAIP